MNSFETGDVPSILWSNNVYEQKWFWLKGDKEAELNPLWMLSLYKQLLYFKHE